MEKRKYLSFEERNGPDGLLHFRNDSFGSGDQRGPGVGDCGKLEAMVVPDIVTLSALNCQYPCLVTGTQLIGGTKWLGSSPQTVISPPITLWFKSLNKLNVVLEVERFLGIDQTSFANKTNTSNTSITLIPGKNQIL